MNPNVCRRTRRNCHAFSTMSAQLTIENVMSTRRTILAIGPAFQTRARMPPLRVSLPTNAPFVCVLRIYGIITTTVRRALVLPLVLAAISIGAREVPGQDARAVVEAFVARVSDVQISDLVIDQNLTLYDQDGQRRVSGGEQRMLFKLPQRQRGVGEQRERALPNGARLFDLTLSEHRPLLGKLYFPYRQEVFVDGKLLVLITIRSIAINTNPADSLFDPANLKSP